MPRKVYFVVLWVLAILLGAATLSLAGDDTYKWGKITDEQWALGAPEDYPEANAIIIFDRASMKVTLQDITTDYHVRIKILVRAGAEEAGERTFVYDSELEKVKNFKAHTITPDGKKTEVKKDAIFNKTVGDLVFKIFAFPVLDSGCIIEYSYTVISERYRRLSPWYFQNNIYTLESEYSVALYPGFSYNVSYQNVPSRQQTPVVEERVDVSLPVPGGAKIKTFTWRMENIPPVKDEPYMSCEDNYRSSLRFQLVTFDDQYNHIKFLSTWAKLGEDYQKGRLDIYCNKGGDIKKMAQEVTQGLTSPLEQSMAIFKFVTDEFKTSREYTDGIFVHEKMSDLLKNKYGSEAEKNLLLIGMHQALGLKAWPVLIGTRDHAKLNPSNPDLRQFNYMVAFVQFDNDWVFLDASSRHGIYGLLPPPCLVEGGFLIDGSQSDLVRVTMKPTESARKDVTRMYVANDGSVTCSTTCCFTGYYALSYLDYYDSNTPDDFIKKYLTERVGASCELGQYECTTDSLNRFIMTAHFTANDLSRRLDNNLIIKPVRFAYGTNPFKSERRFFPVDFSYPFTYYSLVEIYSEGTPADMAIPEDVAMEITGAKLVRRSFITDSCLVIETVVDVTDPEFAPGRYRALRGLFDKIARVSEDEITLILADTE